ncbi:hypothetical protein EDD17DRAFT_1086483 [Pisolithus thermaeus]|nr:hypothetical protein EDD17DRAFT_1086483 [Pisolithus thermaeus]
MSSYGSLTHALSSPRYCTLHQPGGTFRLLSTARRWSRRFFARALYLIAVPSLFYMTVFETRLQKILGSSGDRAAFTNGSEFWQTFRAQNARYFCRCVVVMLIMETLTNSCVDVGIASCITTHYITATSQSTFMVAQCYMKMNISSFSSFPYVGCGLRSSHPY